MAAKTRTPWFTVTRKDIRRDTFRCGGPGGQNQNKRDTGVRLTHISTGISAESREQRSQHQNERLALHKLADRLVAYYLKQEKKQGPQRVNEVIRTYNQPENYVKDHATGEMVAFKDTFGKGKMDAVIDAHTRHVLMSR